jgi:hypothetical protein
MYSALIKVYLIAAAIQFGFSLKDLEGCASRQCVQKLSRTSNEVIKINWKPISVFPAEATRFR